MDIKLPTHNTKPNKPVKLKGHLELIASSYPVVREYLALPTIREKLRFYAPSRPGIKLVKSDQERLRRKRENVKRLTDEGLSSDCFKNNLSFALPDSFRFERWLSKQWDQAFVERDKRESNPRKKLGLPINTPEIKKIGGYFYCVIHNEERDYNYYSKSYTNRYGPRITKTTFVKFADTNSENIWSIEVKPSGNYVLNAGIKLGLFKDVKSPAPLKIRIKKCFDAILIKRVGNTCLYSRTLNGSLFDYCATIKTKELGLIAYHSSSKKSAIDGLRKKYTELSKKRLSDDSQVLTVDYCKSLGFCQTGINSFLSDFDLLSKDKITVTELRKHVKSHRSSCAAYRSELKKLGVI